MCLLLTTAPRIVVGVLLSVLTSLHKPTLTAGDGVLQALADPARCSATQQRLLMVRAMPVLYDDRVHDENCQIRQR